MLARHGLTKLILDLIEKGSLLATDAVVSAIVPLSYASRSHRNYDKRHRVKSAIDKLITRGLLEFGKSNRGKTYIKITSAGRKQLCRYQLGNLKIEKPKHWDGKWRVIIFDIKEFRRAGRDHFRRGLERFGFKKLQNSVWILPYDCEELILLLKSNLGFGREVLYLTVERLENDHWLRRLFALR